MSRRVDRHSVAVNSSASSARSAFQSTRHSRGPNGRASVSSRTRRAPEHAEPRARAERSGAARAARPGLAASRKSSVGSRARGAAIGRRRRRRRPTPAASLRSSVGLGPRSGARRMSSVAFTYGRAYGFVTERRKKIEVRSASRRPAATTARACGAPARPPTLAIPPYRGGCEGGNGKGGRNHCRASVTRAHRRWGARSLFRRLALPHIYMCVCARARTRTYICRSRGGASRARRGARFLGRHKERSASPSAR